MGPVRLSPLLLWLLLKCHVVSLQKHEKAGHCVVPTSASETLVWILVHLEFLGQLVLLERAAEALAQM